MLITRSEKPGWSSCSGRIIPDFKDGEQLRDFIFVKDVVDVLFFLMKRGEQSGIYNLGTGKARTFLDLARATFRAMDMPENIVFIDTPVGYPG